MSKAIVIPRFGGSEVLEYKDVDVGDPGPGEVRLKHTAIGVNFIDVYVRSGLYSHMMTPPGIPGSEAAAVVEAVGSGVSEYAEGDRVAYACNPVGAYSQHRVMATDHLVKLPDHVDDRSAAAGMLKGLTAEYLLHRTHNVVAGERLLIHAGAGGMGLILCQWANHLGAEVIASVGTEEKCALARRAGADHVINYRQQNLLEEVQHITDGHGVDVVYDAVGRATLHTSLDCLAPFGHLVSYGQASGPITHFDLSLLAAKSATLSRPVLFHYTADRAWLDVMANRLFEQLESGLYLHIGQDFALKDAALAHRELEAGHTTGSSLLLP